METDRASELINLYSVPNGTKTAAILAEKWGAPETVLKLLIGKLCRSFL